MSHTVNGIEVMMSEQDLAPLVSTLKIYAHPITVLEYGSGGSTSVFADHLGDQHRLCSVEHHKGWYETVGNRLANHPASDRITRILAPLSFHTSLWKFARPEEEMGAGAEHYIWAPERNPEGWNWSNVGLAFVDGIARGPCLAYLRTRLSPGTPVFVHDYTGREVWYDWAVNLYNRVNVHDLTIELRVPAK